MHRNPRIRDHFYTVDFGLFGSGREGWVYQGIQCYVFRKNVAGTVPFYRFWNMKELDDFYSVENKLNGNTAYQMKGISAYVAPTQLMHTIPLYRYYSTEAADHYYTTSYSVLEKGRDGWTLQGIAAYVWQHPNATDSVSAANPAPTVTDTPTKYVDASGKTVVVDLNGKPTSETNTLPAQASVDTPLLVPLYRYWNTIYRDHFYTTSYDEVEAGGKDGWEYQGVQALIYANPQPNSDALHRYWNMQTLDHFFTTNFDALGKGGKDGWVYEGVTGFIAKSASKDMVALLRYYNADMKDHFYTVKDIGTEARGYKYEGIAGYVLPSFFKDC